MTIMAASTTTLKFTESDLISDALTDLERVLKRKNVRATAADACAQALECCTLGVECVDERPKKAMFLLGVAVGLADAAGLLSPGEYASIEALAMEATRQ